MSSIALLPLIALILGTQEPMAGAPAVQQRAPLLAAPTPTPEAAPNASTLLKINDSTDAAEISVNDIGILSWSYLNKRNPPLILGKYLRTFAACVAGRTPSPTPSEAETLWNQALVTGKPDDRCAALSAKVVVRFRNVSSGRDVEVTVAVPRKTGTECGHGLGYENGTETTCTQKVRLSQGDTKDLPVQAMLDIVFQAGGFDIKKVNEIPPVAFKVSLIPDDLEISRNRGEFRLVAGIAAGGTPLAIDTSFDATVKRSVITDLSAVTKGFNESDVGLLGDEVWNVPFIARVKVSQSLGRSAEAAVTLDLRKGALGDQSSQVSASTFFVRTYALTPWSLQVGRFSVAAPAGGIAISESGDALRVGFKDAGLTYLLRRARTLSPSVPRSDAWIAETGLVALTERVGAGLTYMQGREPAEIREVKTASQVYAHKYWVLGGSVRRPWSNVDATVVGESSVSFFTARRSQISDVSSLRPGNGWVGLLQTSIGVFEELADKSRKKKYFIRLRYGQGSGDKPSTTTDESYIGESQSFAPDEIFLSAIAGQRYFRNDVEKIPALDATNPALSPLVPLTAHRARPSREAVPAGGVGATTLERSCSARKDLRREGHQERIV